MAKEIVFHPIVHAFPPHTPAQYARLRESIRLSGCMQPPVLYRDTVTKVCRGLDGFHRVKACREENKPIPTPIIVECTEAEAILLAWELNDERRHWQDKGERQMAAAEVVKYLRQTKSVEYSNEYAAKNIFKVASLQTGIPVPTLERADQVARNGSIVLQEAVKTGTIAVSDASAIVDQPKMVQNEAVREVASGRAKTVRKALAKIVEQDAAASSNGHAVDDNGTPIPERCLPAFAAVAQIESFCRHLDTDVAGIKELAAQPGGWLIHKDSHVQVLNQVRKSLWQTRPAYVCPYCRGGALTKEPCSGCNGHGLVNKSIYDNAPAERKVTKT